MNPSLIFQISLLCALVVSEVCFPNLLSLSSADPHGFPGNDWRPEDGPHVVPAFRFAECVRDADREMLAAQHKPGSFFVVATYQTFARATRNINPGIPTCYYTVGLSDRLPPRNAPVSVTIREFRRTDPGALPGVC